jgi:thiamine-phosphate pyrophosphorylase
VIRCLVTDRRRLCGEHAPIVVARRALVALVERACADGVDFVQVRERDLEARDLAALVADVVAAARGSRTRVLVNDRVDVALACGADGVHLRADSMPVPAVRRLAPPPFLVGRSIHSADEARLAVGADYVIAGTVFPTASKPDAHPVLGVAGLAAIVRETAVPVLAIGGITADRVPDVLAAGAAGYAAIGLFIDTVRTPS